MEIEQELDGLLSFHSFDPEKRGKSLRNKKMGTVKLSLL